MANFKYEEELWKKGNNFIAGVDEVGRGCFAGPIVAGCVVFAPDINLSTDVKIDDSKKLTPGQREKAAKWIKENAIAWGVGEAGAGKINSLGMGRATKMAFRKSISLARKKLGKSIDYLLIDAFFISYVPGLASGRRKNKRGRFYKATRGRQLAIINGDEKSVTIAAASIIAKVYRDELMLALSKKPKNRKYGWGRNKGYGTHEHQIAIKKYGLTRQHRKTFVETWLKKLNAKE